MLRTVDQFGQAFDEMFDIIRTGNTSDSRFLAMRNAAGLLGEYSEEAQNLSRARAKPLTWT